MLLTIKSMCYCQLLSKSNGIDTTDGVLQSKQEQNSQRTDGASGRSAVSAGQKLWMKSAPAASKPSSTGSQKPPVPAGANKGSQKAKPMPTHFGPKIRHRDRGQRPVVKKKPAKVESKAEKMKRRREYADVHGKVSQLIILIKKLII